ncbi:hypothetical protein [Lutispora thermophila]|uniref:Transglutaminase-like superfamily protein n=1 Tax=Lutispora thermophila DSM 19022 TaxID=1122184 RepID=A0A1M6BSA0_9FIRM|nr:hypothetical protein [Lutispora thermophila]SHI51474.1 hypothetical protein SAMN02745176_00506 [Lutispora thermophila DSM 19022]
MKKKLILILILASFFLSGCENKSVTFSQYRLAEEPEIKKTLGMLSDAILSGDAKGFINCFSSDCPFFHKINQYMSSLKLNDINFNDFSMDIENLTPLGDGIEASVKIKWDATVKDSKKCGSLVRKIYLSRDNDIWKIKDYNFHIYSNPTVVVGRSSLLLSNGEQMANALESQLLLDTQHLQNTGDIILLGTAYDNASILEMEINNLTYIRVTEDYPGRGLGIVQVIPNVEQYRHVIIIQGSTLQDAKDSIGFMTDYLIAEKYMEPGVYIIKDKKIRKAELLELTSLTSFDYNKATETLERAKGIIEYNIKLICDEIALEKDNIISLMKNTSDEHRKDYKETFSYNSCQSSQKPHPISMGLICSYLINKDLCTKAFQLPPKGNADILNSAAMNGEGLNVSSMTALLRLAGLGENQVFSLRKGDGSIVFANIGEGYALDFDSIVFPGVFQHCHLEEAEHMENEGYYIDFKKNLTNMDSEDIMDSINKLHNAFNPEKDILKSKMTRGKFSSDENLHHISLPYNIHDIYVMLQANAPYYQTGNAFNSLKEARESLKEAMGQLLWIKLRKHVISLASKYPGSQYDYSLYSAGLINVKHPEAYAEAARESAPVKKKSSEIGSASKEADDKIRGILSLLSTIKERNKEEDSLLHPDICLETKCGKVIDKALLAYGLYANLFNKAEEAWIAIGDGSSYLVIKDDYGYKYVDCKYNSLSRLPDSTIYLCFNEKYAYNGRLGIGSKPEFLN